MMLLLSAVVNPNWNEFKIEDDDIFEQCKLYLYVLSSVWMALFVLYVVMFIYQHFPLFCNSIFCRKIYKMLGWEPFATCTP